MTKILFSAILFLGVIPCDPAFFTLFKNPEMGETIVRGLNLIVCAISAFYAILYSQRKHLYGSIVVKYMFFFLTMIVFNSLGTMLSGEMLSTNSRTMSLICLCAYYIYVLYAFNDTHSLIKSINLALFILIIMSLITYYTNYENATYIENATTRCFKGVAKNRNSYAEITLFYIASNLYLWSKSKKHSIFYFVTTVMAGYTTYLTHSATATICIVLLLGLALFYKFTQKTLPFKTMMIGYITLFIFLIILQSGNIPFLSNIIEHFQKDATLTGRTEIWKTALTLISENPLFGKGYDTVSLFTHGVPENDPHNSILYMLLTQGLVGTTIFFVLFFRTIIQAKKLVNDTPLFSYMYIFIIVWMVRGLTESAFTYTHFVFWIAIIIIEMLIKDKKNKFVEHYDEKELYQHHF